MLIDRVLGPHPPSSDWLVGNYKNHRTDFQRLVDLHKRDQFFSSIKLDVYTPVKDYRAKAPPKIVNNYRVIMRRIGVDCAGFDIKGGGATFDVYSWGFATSSITYGYEYMPVPPAWLKDGKTVHESDSLDSSYHVEHIEGNWYWYSLAE